MKHGDARSTRRWISKRCTSKRALRVELSSIAYSWRCTFAGSCVGLTVAPGDACTGVPGAKSNCTFDPENPSTHPDSAATATERSSAATDDRSLAVAALSGFLIY